MASVFVIDGSCRSSCEASCITVRRFGSLRRIRLPFLTTRAAPIVLPRAKPAVVAFVEAETLDVLPDEALDELEVVAAIGRRSEQLRFEQPIEADQRRVSRELVLDKRCSGIGALCFERQREQRIQKIERWVLRLVIGEQADARREVAQAPICVRETISGEREEGGILRFDPLPSFDRGEPIARLRRDVAGDQIRARTGPMRRERALDLGGGRHRIRLEQRDRRELAMVLRDLLVVRLLRKDLHPFHRDDGLRPVLLGLVDLDQVRERGMLERRVVELAKKILGAVEKPRAMEVLRKLVGGHRSLVRRQRGSIEQVLMHAYRAFGFTLATKERAKREMQVDRLRIDLDDLDERLDRLVRLLVQKEVEAAKIRERKRT